MSLPITFQFNNRSFELEAPKTIIEAADQLGIYIPRFCYHKKLSVVANCRMCLVEVEGLPKPVPACATALTPDMRILTRSAKTKAAQKAVMEFLLINHPLDCPICDQGGQCELQDLAMGYGQDNSNFSEMKRSVPNDDLGSLIATEMTRCIQCTRCVRFGSEVAGKMELGAMDRGEHTQITTRVKQHLQSELSGNMIDVCPVGALTSKPFRFKARTWEMRSFASIAPHDCLGSHTYIHTHDQQVMRVVPRENEAINEVWLSDRDRYAYLGLKHPDRLKEPMIKGENGWEKVNWLTALNYAADLLKNTVNQYGAAEVGGLISPSATLEEMYIFQKLLRHLGSSNIDHRLHATDYKDQRYLPKIPCSDISISDLEKSDFILLVGSHLQREQPLLTTRLRKAIEQGSRIASLNCVDYDFNFKIAHKVVVSPTELANTINQLLTASQSQSIESRPVKSKQALFEIAAQLSQAKKAVIITGALLHNHPEAAYLRYVVSQLKAIHNVSVMHLTEGANSTGAWLAGAVPHQREAGQLLSEQKVGRTAHEMIEKAQKAYLLFNVEPDFDCANPYKAQLSMQSAESVIAFTSFVSDGLLRAAHVLLPINCFSENEGTLINIEGKWQRFQPAMKTVGESRLGWNALQHLAQILNINEAFDLETIESVLKPALESSNQSENISSVEIKGHLVAPSINDAVLTRITEWPLYSIDALVRRSHALQQSGSCEKSAVYLHPHCAERLNVTSGQMVRLRQGEGLSDWLPVIFHAGVPDRCVLTLAARAETRSLGASFGEVEILVGNKHE